MADPRFLMAHCLTEPRGASDRWLPYNVPEANMDTSAVYEDGHWTINGRKQFISNGYDASLYVVYANTDRSAGMLEGTSSFLVPRDTPGLAVTRCNETVGGRYMNNGEIVFEDCRVPQDHLLALGDALGKAGVYFRPGKIIQAAKNLGIGIAAFDDTAAFVQHRVQGGRTLIKHQAVAVRLAAMATKLEAVSALLRHAATAVDANAPEAARLCDMVKVFASQEILHGLPARGRTARRLRGDARSRGREVFQGRRRIPAHGCHRGCIKLQDRESDVPGHRRSLRRTGMRPRRRSFGGLGGRPFLNAKH